MKKVIVISLGIAALASTSWAIPFNPQTAAAGSLSGLESTLTGFGSSIDVYNQEKGAELFEVTGPVASAWLFHFSGADGIQFGIYDASADKSSLGDAETLELFNGMTGDASGDVTVILDGSTFLAQLGAPLAGGTAGDDVSAGPTVLDTSNNFNTFGFYLKTGNGYLFSESDANMGGVDYFLTYQGVPGDMVGMGSAFFSDTPEHWYIAGGLTQDAMFNDLVVRTESISPVPEPASMLLLGSGLLGLAGLSRRKKTVA